MCLFDLSLHQMICSRGDYRNLYEVQQINGQFIATFKHVAHPKRGTEIFMKKIPRDILLQDLFEFVVQCGDIYSIRLLMDFSGYNRGYCFITYFEAASARKAVLTLNGEKIKENYSVLVKISIDNNKLELRGIPPEISRNEIFATMSEVIGDGLKGVITFKKNNDKYPNNLCLLKYDTHRHAVEARKKIWPKIKLWGRTIEIDWAIPRQFLEAKRLYFRNLPPNIAKLEFYEEITKYVHPETMLNVFLHCGLGYLLFTNGSVAFDAFLTLRTKKLFGNFLEYSFAKFYTHLNGGDNFSTLGSLGDRTTLEYMNGTERSDLLNPSWECCSSSADETALCSRPSSSSEENYFAYPPTSFMHEGSQYVDFDKDFPTTSSFLPQQYESQSKEKVSYSKTESGLGIANWSFSTENILSSNVGAGSLYPSVVIPPPILTLPGPYDEATEIHHCKSGVSVSNAIRILPTVNHNQYDFTLVRVSKFMEQRS